MPLQKHQCLPVFPGLSSRGVGVQAVVALAERAAVTPAQPHPGASGARVSSSDGTLTKTQFLPLGRGGLNSLSHPLPLPPTPQAEAWGLPSLPSGSPHPTAPGTPDSAVAADPAERTTPQELELHATEALPVPGKPCGHG